jgi:hypothetical protein
MFLSPMRSLPRSVSRLRACAPLASLFAVAWCATGWVWELAIEASVGQVPTGHSAAVPAVAMGELDGRPRG